MSKTVADGYTIPSKDIEELIAEAIAEYIEPYIVNCVQNNGTSTCKNCGLSRLKEESKR